MRLIFAKGADKTDTLTIVRSGRADEVVDCPKQRIIPHNMVHYAAESILDARGFLGRVASGEAADFHMGPQAESDGVERLVEVLQGDGWSGGGTPAGDMIDLYRVTCAARGCPALQVDAGVIDAIRARMTELTIAWDAVPVGDTLELTFGDDGPHPVLPRR